MSIFFNKDYRIVVIIVDAKQTIVQLFHSFTQCGDDNDDDDVHFVLDQYTKKWFSVVFSSETTVTGVSKLYRNGV
jgi:hypothetical protein